MSFEVQIGESTSQREYEAIGCSDEGIWKGLAWPIVSSIFQKVLVEAGTSKGLMGPVDDGDFLIWLRRRDPPRRDRRFAKNKSLCIRVDTMRLVCTIGDVTVQAASITPSR